MHEPFGVAPYSDDALAGILSLASGSTGSAGKAQFKQLDQHLKALGARTVVVEPEYVDRDYLEDYAGFYVRCFHPYPQRCVRVHFFSKDFTEAAFRRLLRGEVSADVTAAQLQEKYLGFVVAKPLPDRTIGRTCLKVLEHDGDRFYAASRAYCVTMFGLPLSVRSLAFQEQDRVAAACATSALWTVFHGTQPLFHQPAPSPLRITEAATAAFPAEMRTVPSQGLTVLQMAHAIRAVGLEPLPTPVRSADWFCSFLYAYLRAGIPVLLISQMFDPSANWKALGRHAVAVVGAHFREPSAGAAKQASAVQLRASRIDSLYVHDDQVGPFVPMAFDRLKAPPNGPGAAVPFTLATLHPGKADPFKTLRAGPETLLVPLYHKVRIGFAAVHEGVLRFGQLVNVLQGSKVMTWPGTTGALEWDIYLTTSTDFKASLLDEGAAGPDLRERVLVRSLPRFLWRARATRPDGSAVWDLLFDATDVDNGHVLLDVLPYDEQATSAVAGAAKLEDVRIRYSGGLAEQILLAFGRLGALPA